MSLCQWQARVWQKVTSVTLVRVDVLQCATQLAGSNLMAGGILYCVATPIGNLEDMSARARRILGEVDKIYAEDTRVTRSLLNHFGIQNTLASLHDHNESERIAGIQAELEQGMQLALVSDAGTPLISDPGFKLVQVLGQAGYNIVPIPGASALVTALSVAGLPTDRFVFEGFLAAKPAARRQHLEALQAEERTLVFYESSHRITAMLADIASVLGSERQVVVLRELTKLYESIYRGSVAAVQARIAADSNATRGEFVVVVAGHAAAAQCDTASASAEQVLRVLLDEGLPLKQAAAIAARLSGLPKNALYKQALAMAAL